MLHSPDKVNKKRLNILSGFACAVAAGKPCEGIYQVPVERRQELTQSFRQEYQKSLKI
jgi:hypothetical protein